VKEKLQVSEVTALIHQLQHASVSLLGIFLDRKQRLRIDAAFRNVEYHFGEE
jgi:hypothetical protein